ncbi:MAG: putative pentaheme protein [uncultured bacterium]|nr:MAG: putative pentaheme protein [uncultured bacterium]
MNKFLLLCCLLFSGVSQATEAPVICGLVTDLNNNPVESASVRWQAADIKTLTDQSGRFCLPKTDALITNSKNITAGKEGYYITGQKIEQTTTQTTITLKPVPEEDQNNYQFLSAFRPHQSAKPSHEGENNSCDQCHPEIVTEFKADRHSQSAQNELFLKMFNGTGDRQTGFGYKTDFPNSNGNCASCHQPVAAINQPYHTDPNTVSGVAKEGVNCDFCHKIKNASVDRTGGHPGVLSYQFSRPQTGHQTFYGPLDDVHPGEDSFHPLYAESRYCAPCHNGSFWNTLVYSEYQEWENSDYARQNITCQKCHMPEQKNMTHFALAEKGGLKRVPSTLISHKNLGINDVTFMKDSIALKTTAQVVDNKLHVSVAITNTKAGHHYPTGNPMRNMLLLVETKDDRGNVLPLDSGKTLPPWAGQGVREQGNYAGLPGKGFAKILINASPYPGRASRFDFSPITPSPHWRPAYIHEDTRIAANMTDVTDYVFDLPHSVSKTQVTVITKLIYRRTFKNWQNKLDIDLPDLVLATNSQRLTVNSQQP